MAGEKTVDSISFHFEFASSLLKNAVQVTNEGILCNNIVLSPLSMQLSLCMLSAGANGKTREQILQTLHVSSIPDPHALMRHLQEILRNKNAADSEFCIRLVNSCWFDQSIKVNADFSFLSENNYGSAPSQAAFANEPEKSRLEINHKVEDWTKGKIDNILNDGSITSLTRFVLVNALYFKGLWAKKFDAKLTKEKQFTKLDKKIVTVPFLTSSGRYFMKKDKNFSVLRLPYASPKDSSKSSFCLYLLLPDVAFGLTQLIASLDSNFIQRAVTDIPEVKLSSLSFPKFKFKFKLDAGDCLRSMGMIDPFTDGADFSRLIHPTDDATSPPLSLSHVEHNAFIEVDEEGSEGGASTAIVITLRGLFPTLSFDADRPFLFLLREEVSSSILFIGCVVDPSM